MATVMAAGMVPPIGMAFASTVLYRKGFSQVERENGAAAWLLGASFISEGAIPFAAADPLRVIPSNLIGGAITGALTMAFGITSRAPHGGIFVFFAINNPVLWILSILIGAAVTGFVLVALKRFVGPRAARPVEEPAFAGVGAARRGLIRRRPQRPRGSRPRGRCSFGRLRYGCRMTDAPPGPPPGPRDPADGWVELPDGRRFWGKAGAAGLLVVAPDGSILLQHRVGWSHFGGTWGLPGGARHLGETAVDGALREAHEETGIEIAALRPRFAVRLDLDVWDYTTVVVAAPSALPVSVTDRESTELEWVPADLVTERELHPGFAAAWPRLRPDLAHDDPVLVVDAANVVGSRPDGWWKDRAGAADPAARLARRARVGREPRRGGRRRGRCRSSAAGRGSSWCSRGRRRPRRTSPASRSSERRAPATTRSWRRPSGSPGSPVTVVTADRGLIERVRAEGAGHRGPADSSSLLDAAR